MSREQTSARRRDLRLAATVLVIAVLAACVACAAAGDGGGTPSRSSPEMTGAEPIVYTRQGGFMGERTRLTVSAAGQATLDSRVGARHRVWTHQLSADRVLALRSALDAAGFGRLRSSYRPAGSCSDCFVDTVTYRGRSVSVEGDSAPDGLSAALNLLEGVAAEH